jgi:hypothetical protein
LVGRISKANLTVENSTDATLVACCVSEAV